MAALFKALRDEDAFTGVPTQADYNDMIRRRRRELRHITEQLARGDINPELWADRFDAILLAGHSRAHHLGRRLAGDLRGFNNADMFAGIAAKDKDADFLANFLQGIQDKDPRYVDEEGNLRINSVMNRGNLYLGRMRGTSGQAFVDASPDDDEFDWILGGAEKHCEDCPRLAALSPYAKDTLFTTPGDGDTECLGACLCHLRRRSDRLKSFGTEDPAGGFQNSVQSAPVSNALDVQAPYPISAKVNEAIGIIDKAHTDGVLPETQIYAIIDTPDLGGYFDPGKLEIAINAVGFMPTGTMIHETGHLLDMFGIGKNGRPASARSRRLKPFRDAVKETESFKRIQAIKAGETVRVAGEDVVSDAEMRKHAVYLDDWEEYWARAYYQFVLRRVKDKNLLVEAANLSNSEYQKIFLAQWADKDFLGIEKAIRELFIALGWIVE